VAGTRIEAQLQLTTTIVAERRGTGFLLLGMMAWVAAAFAGAGVGAGPVRRQGTVALLCAATIAWLAAFMFMINRFPALRDFAKSVGPGELSDLTGASMTVAIARIVLVAVLAPVSEELFFRGWLWEALRRREHTVITTVCLTAIPWLLLHGIDAPGRILFIMPAAVILSLARYVGGSVRASIATHMTNNGIAILVQTVMMLFSDGE
jgi:membrane protease YdiL (CAAX protease family)